MNPEEALQEIRSYLHDLAQHLATVAGLLDFILLEQEDNPSLYKEYKDIRMFNEQISKVIKIINHIRKIAQSVT